VLRLGSAHRRAVEVGMHAPRLGETPAAGGWAASGSQCCVWWCSAGGSGAVQQHVWVER
jgi:hypothetical protein